MPEATDSFGVRLYELRRAKNVSQEELAELLDVSRQSISKWENDKAYPEMTRLLCMSEYFGVSLDYLMRGVEGTQAPAQDDAAYTAQSLERVWKHFISNLTQKQRRLVTLLGALVLCACGAILISFLYQAGYALGKTVAHLTH